MIANRRAASVGDWSRMVSILVIVALAFLPSVLGDYEFPDAPSDYPNLGPKILTPNSGACSQCGYPECGCPNLTMVPTPQVGPLITPMFDMLPSLPTVQGFPTTFIRVTIVPDVVRPVPPDPGPVATSVFNPPFPNVPTVKPTSPVPVYTLVP